MQIILVTHPRTGDLRDSLKYIYNLYVEYVVKNPLYSPGSPIRLVKIFFSMRYEVNTMFILIVALHNIVEQLVNIFWWLLL